MAGGFCSIIIELVLTASQQPKHETGLTAPVTARSERSERHGTAGQRGYILGLRACGLRLLSQGCCALVSTAPVIAK